MHCMRLTPLSVAKEENKEGKANTFLAWIYIPHFSDWSPVIVCYPLVIFPRITNWLTNDSSLELDLFLCTFGTAVEYLLLFRDLCMSCRLGFWPCWFDRWFWFREHSKVSFFSFIWEIRLNGLCNSRILLPLVETQKLLLDK